MSETTLLIIKPDAVCKNVIGEIINRVEQRYLRISNLRMVAWGEKLWKDFYEGLESRIPAEAYATHIAFLCSANSVLVAVKGDDAILRVRELVGATDPKKAAPFTLRFHYGTDLPRNAVHCSDGPQSARRELEFFSIW